MAKKKSADVRSIHRVKAYRYDYGDDSHNDIGNGRDNGVDAAANG